MIGADLFQDQIDLLDLLHAYRRRSVDDMQQQIGMDGFFKRGAECGHQLMRQFAHEADRVRDHHVAHFLAQVNPARGGIERGEQLVGNIHAGLGHGIEQGRLAGIGIADQGHRECVIAAARTALRFALLVQFFQARAQGLDTVADQPAVRFKLRLAGTAQADTALLPFQVSPAADQARGQMLQLGQLDLQLALVALGALREDVEDQAGTVEHPHVQALFQIALLSR